ncbi:PPR CONTAINING PLANT-LIKE PROTEIN [Salix viminalis]|uniref:PPR CONTAINING PLANT-LIKE PROTEIN n=1 Tax=Salix viminalis TaxID=40686 RepID=A0A9Q0NRE3_SALVM|nr:PPR CONTAINING PLANT-LIKE PROTEIN [Salix viminalis]
MTTCLHLRRFSTFNRSNTIPHRTIPEPKGQDLDFVNVVHSHLIHCDWDKLKKLSAHFTPFRVNHILLKIQKDHVLSLEFFNSLKTLNPISLTLETHSIILHVLTKKSKFKSAQSILRTLLASRSIDLPGKLFDTILFSYRMCDSSPRVFDSLFKTYAHMNKFRNATDVFSRMKEKCVGVGYRRIHTLLTWFCLPFASLGNLKRPLKCLGEMESVGITPNVVSYNTLIAGHCNKGLLSIATKFKNLMGKNGLEPNVVTFNSLIHGFCKEGKLHEANRSFSEMKVMNVTPDTVTYNTLINGYGQVGNSNMAGKVYDEMLRNGVKTDILTYNALILGLCKEGKTKKAAFLVKELDKEDLVPNASTFSALISGQCARKNSDRAFQLYKSMVRSGCHPNEQTFKMLISAFIENEDFEGAFNVLMDMFARSMASDSNTLLEICDGLCQCGKESLAMKLCHEMKARRLIPEGFDRAEHFNSMTEKENRTFG